MANGFSPEEAIAYIAENATRKGVWPLSEEERQEALSDLLSRAKRAKRRQSTR